MKLLAERTRIIRMPLTINDKVQMYYIYLRFIYLLAYKSFKSEDKLVNHVHVCNQLTI